MDEIYKKIIRNIKSPYITKEVFSYLDKKQKLNIIIYNKKLQKMLIVDVEDYKEMSEKYRIGERNGKGKEYFKYNDRLRFEGEYLNGKRNGKGKQSDIFEGEYLNGMRNGKGKEYYDGKVLFEGEYLNDKRHGNGIEYYVISNYKDDDDKSEEENEEK